MKSVDLVSGQGSPCVVYIPFPERAIIGNWYVDSALFSTLSMTRLATVTDTGEPMAVLNVCLKNSPLYARKVASRQN